MMRSNSCRREDIATTEIYTHINPVDVQKDYEAALNGASQHPAPAKYDPKEELTKKAVNGEITEEEFTKRLKNDPKRRIPVANDSKTGP